MCTRPMIVDAVTGQDSPQVPLPEHDHMVQTCAPDCTDQALRIRILPGARRTRDDFADADTCNAASEDVAIHGVAIPQRPSRCGGVGEGFNDLLRRPLSRRMLCDIEVDDPS